MSNIEYIKRTYQSEIDRLEAINSLQLTKIKMLEELNSKYESERRAQVSLANRERNLESKEQQYESRKKYQENRLLNGQRYEALTKCIHAHEGLQQEWVTFMSLLKLMCEPEEIKDLY